MNTNDGTNGIIGGILFYFVIVGFLFLCAAGMGNSRGTGRKNFERKVDDRGFMLFHNGDTCYSVQ